MAAAGTSDHSLPRGRSFAKRMLHAAWLRADLYEEVEADRSATNQALAVVLLSGLATGIGSWANSGVEGLIWHSAIAVVGWYLWAALALAIGTRLLPGEHTRADLGEMLRALGFASAPGVLRVLMLFPPIAFGVLVACTLWMLAAMVVAVRQALDYHGTARALAVCALGLPVYAIPLALSLLVLGPWPV